MEIITTEIIDLQWKNIENLDLDEIPNLINLLGDDQPFLLTYLMATGLEILNQKEREVLLFLGIMIWNITKPFTKDIYKEISTAELLTKETKNISMLEYLSGEPDEDFLPTVEKIMVSFHQCFLLKYILDRLMEERDDDSSGIREENIGIILIFLKTIIDCIDNTF